MNMNEDKKPFLDLHPSEWSREKKREPVFGPGGAYLLIMFLLSFPITIGASLLVYGELPYFVMPIIEGLAGIIGYPLTIITLGAVFGYPIYLMIRGWCLPDY